MKNTAILVVLFVIVATMSTSCGVQHRKKRYVKRNYKELKKSFPEATVTLLQDSIKVIFPNNVVFDVGSATVRKTFDAKLLRFSQILKKYDRTNILVTGYTDNSGSDDSNVKLSLERAETVKSKLIKEKVQPKRLFTWGLGEKNPISSNATKEGRAKNRRVEFVVLYNADSE